MADFGMSSTSETDLVKHLVAYGVQAEDAKAALSADASSFQAVMETLLANVFRISSSWLQPFYSYTPDLESPEALDESISEWNFYSALKECLEKIGVTGFRWKDLHEPSSKQVKRHLVEIVNFARFCEWHEGTANATQEEYIDWTEQNEELQARLDEYLLDVEERHADEKSKLTSLTREYESLLAENTRSREAADRAQKQVLSMEEKRGGTLQAVEDLKAHLCEDHDEVIKDLQREKQLCEEYQEECNDASTQASFYAKWSSDANEMKQEVMRGIRMAEETLVAQNFDKEISQQLADTVEAVQAVEASTNAIVERKAEQDQQQQASAEEQQLRLNRLEADDARVAAEVEYLDKQRAHAAARAELLQQSVTEVDAEASAAAKQTEEVKSGRLERRAQCMAQYEAAPAMVSDFMLRVVGLLESDLQTQQQGDLSEDQGATTPAQLVMLQDRMNQIRSTATSLKQVPWKNPHEAA